MSEKAEHLFDKRTSERNLAGGRITRREYESYMGHLPDAQSKSELLFEDESKVKEESEPTDE